jgi:hypothetical protein
MLNQAGGQKGGGKGGNTQNKSNMNHTFTSHWVSIPKFIQQDRCNGDSTSDADLCAFV